MDLNIVKMNNEQLVLPVSVGEALDKYSILEIKKNKIKNEERLRDVDIEMKAIYKYISKSQKKYDYQYKCLKFINEEIWDLSEQVRDPNLSKEIKDSLFLETFYKNDARFRIKSKLNKLTSSNIREQKSYPTSNIMITGLYKIPEKDKDKNSYIRYLSLCYDLVIIQCDDLLINNVSKLYADDPHITIVSYNKIITNVSKIISIDENNMEEHIPNLYKKYDFSYEGKKSINYICGGRLGDFIHSLYVIMCKYKMTGSKGKLYITDNLAWGGDHFTFDIKKTYDELYDIVISQKYIESFSIYTNEHIDVNLNSFRHYHRLYYDSWLEIMAYTFGVTLIEKPWIKFLPDSKYYDAKYKDVILIHRSLISQRYVPGFIELVSSIIKNNKCLFITCNIKEYEAFPLKTLVTLELKSTLSEMYSAINSCKFFIGNQSSPLALAYSLFKPLLCESSEGRFYINKHHYSSINWVSINNKHLNYLTENILYNNLKDKLNYEKMTFYGQFETDKHIAGYFPSDYVGTCLDVGMAEPIGSNNSFHFEQRGWKCLCVEPNPTYYKMGLECRKYVENVACGKNDVDSVDFEIFTINGTNQGAISSLKRDDRLVQSHLHMIQRIEKIKVNVRTLDTILTKYPDITSIDFVSIDTEDTELDVLKGFDINKWKPKLFVIENNHDEPFIADYLKSFGYKRDKRVVVNDFFILDN